VTRRRFPGRRAGRAVVVLGPVSGLSAAIGSFPLGLVATAGRLVAITAGCAVMALALLGLFTDRRTRRRPSAEGDPR